MRKKRLKFTVALVAVIVVTLRLMANAEEFDPCSLLENPETRAQISAALELKLSLQCGLVSEEALAAGQQEAAGEVPVSVREAFGTDLRINSPADTGANSTQSETSIVVVGNAVCAAFNDSGSFPPSFTGYAYSSNGGATWTDGGSFPSDSELDNSYGDPSLAYSVRDNAIYFASLSDLGLSIWRSNNGCQSFTYVGPIHVGDGDDKELMTIDSNPSSPYYGRIYVAWTDFSAGGRIFSTFSNDGGVTWSTPVALSTIGAVVQGAWPAVSPNGDVYVGWVRWNPYPIGPIDIEIVRSTNGGASYGLVTNPLTGAVNPRDNSATLACERPALNGDIRYLPSPQIAVSSDGTLHVVYSYDPDGNGVGDVINVYYRRSTNQGASWGPQVQLNDDGTSTDQWFPAIAVNSGNVVVTSWYDRRLDTANNMDFDRYVRVSPNGGLTWAPSTRISDVSSPVSNIRPNFDTSVNDCYHGDYDQIAVDGTTAHIIWSDDRRITASGPNPDIYHDTQDLAVGERKERAKLRGPDQTACDGPKAGKTVIIRKENGKVIVKVKFVAGKGPPNATFDVYWTCTDVPSGCHSDACGFIQLGQVTTDATGFARTKFKLPDGNPFPGKYVHLDLIGTGGEGIFTSRFGSVFSPFNGPAAEGADSGDPTQ